MQTWVTKIVKNHRFVCRQPCAYHAKPGSECYVIDQFIETIVEWSQYCTLLDAVRRLRVIRNSTENLHWLIRDEVATLVSEHSLQKTSVVALSKYCWYKALSILQNSSVNCYLSKSVVLCWKMLSKAVLLRQTSLFQGRCATDTITHKFYQ